MSKRFCLNKHSGFTLIEIMLVVVIIGILAATIGPKIAGKSDTAKIQATKDQMRSVETALGMFEVKATRYPTTEEGLQALVTKPGGLEEDEWEQAMKEVPLDSYKQDFIYRSPGEGGKEFDLFSKGKDKQEGTKDDIHPGSGRKQES
ncbi:MAG: type II secretion system major pseudopilin GspG [Candidatus Sumerlaeaceae bacterium]